MKSIFGMLAAGAMLAALSVPSNASTLVSETFDTGSAGWSSLSFFADLNDDHPIFTDVVGSYGVTWSATGGNPGGTINLADQDSGWQYFVASGAFLGNQAAAEGGTLSFDLMRTDSNSGFPSQTAPALAITNGTTILVFTGGGAPTTGGWTSYDFTLSASAGDIFVTTATGPQATQAQINAVLGNLTGVYILSDWYTGIGDAYDLDNVILSSAASTPEPSTYALTFAGLAGLAAWAKRSRRT